MIENSDFDTRFWVRNNKTIEVIHNGKELTFYSVPFGYPTFSNFGVLKENIEKKGLRMPTLSEIVSLFYAASSSENLHFGDEFNEQLSAVNVVNPLFKYGAHLAADTGWMMTNDGLFVKDFCDYDYISHPAHYTQTIPRIEKNNLEEAIKNGADNVRYAEWPFDVHNITTSMIGSHKAIQSLVGKEGGQKLQHILEEHWPIIPYDTTIALHGLWLQMYSPKPKSEEAPIPLIHRKNYGNLSIDNLTLMLCQMNHNCSESAYTFGIVRP